MRGPHPFPDRPLGDLATLREILAALEAQHDKARATGWPIVRAALAMTIGLVRDEIARAEAAAPRPITRPADLFRRLAGDDA